MIGKTNRYAKRVGGLERLFKDVRWWAAVVRSRLAHGSVQYIVTDPEFPSKRASIQAYAWELKWVVTNVDRANAVLRLAFDDTTSPFKTRPAGWMNGLRGDISKSALDVVHLSVFGREVAIDPLIHQGLMLEKSEANAQHDGRELKGPIQAKRDGMVYQRIVNNVLEDGRFVDFRAVVVGCEIPMVYKKIKVDGARYTNRTAEVQLQVCDEVFTQSEQSQLLELCLKMGVDFAELDVLRDAQTHEIFVVDINPTPYGPPEGLQGHHRNRAACLGAEAMRRWVS
jgi:hypothetical protein